MHDGILAEELSPELSALREARRRAAEARAEAERQLREAQAAEAELAVREEQAVISATLQREREAVEALAHLRAQLQQASDRKVQAEAAVAAIRTSLVEHEEHLRNAEIHERALLSDLSIAERRAQEAARLREQAQSGAAAPPPVAEPAAAGPALIASIDDIKAHRAAERRLADAARAAGR